MLSTVNEVNGENLQDPPNQKSWLRQWFKRYHSESFYLQDGSKNQLA